MASDLPYNHAISSPKGERFVITRKGSESITRPVKPFSLLPFRQEIEQIGIDYIGNRSLRLEIRKKRVGGNCRQNRRERAVL